MEHTAVIDIRTPDEIYTNLEKTGLHIIRIPLTDRVDVPLSGHPDIQLFIHGNRAFVHPHIESGFLKQLEYCCEITVCPTPLNAGYPRDIPYNIACTGRYAIHSLKHIEPLIPDYLKDKGIMLLNTKQGYAKCSTLVVDERSIITADRSIDESARGAGMDSLLISPGYVDLPGYKYGFLGGASGRFSDMVFLTGSIDEHPDRNSIYEFIESRRLKVKVLSKWRVLDTGSILVIGQ